MKVKILCLEWGLAGEGNLRIGMITHAEANGVSDLLRVFGGGVANKEQLFHGISHRFLIHHSRAEVVCHDPEYA